MKRDFIDNIRDGSVVIALMLLIPFMVDYAAKLPGLHISTFWLAVPVGIAFIVVGLFNKLGVLDSGFIIGGSFSIVNGYLNNWGKLSDAAHFGSLLAAILLIVGITYVRSKKKAIETN